MQGPCKTALGVICCIGKLLGKIIQVVGQGNNALAIYRLERKRRVSMGKETVVVQTARLDHEQFTLKAINALRQEGRKGIHTVYSGFNNAFKKYFEGSNPVDAIQALEKIGKVTVRPCKGGVMLYLPGEGPAGSGSPENILAKMGL